MTEKFMQVLLAACIGFGLGLAIAAPDVFAQDTDAGAAAALPGTPAPSADAPSISVPPADAPTVSAVAQAFEGGQYLVAFGGLLWILISAARSFADSRKWLTSRWGKIGLAFGLAFASATALSLYDGQAVSLAMLVSAAGAAWMAGGFNEHTKDVAEAAG